MLDKIMKFYFPTLQEDKYLFKLISKTINKLLFLNNFNNLIESIQDKTDYDFLNIFIKKLNKKYSTVNIKNIPKKDKLIIIANHPTGILDPLILLLIVKKIRPDVKVVVNEDLYKFLYPMQNMLLPINLYQPNEREIQITKIKEELSKNSAIIIFPAGKISKLNLKKGIVDPTWKNGFINFSKDTNSPILPIHINANNPLLYNLLNLFNERLFTLASFRIIFKQKSHYYITVGEKIYEDDLISDKNKIYNILYSLPKINKQEQKTMI